MRNAIKFLAIALFAAGSLFASASASAAQADTESVTANVAFDTPLTLTKNTDINFGYVKAAQTGTYVIDTAGAIVASAGGVWLTGTHNAGSLTVVGSTTQTIDITAGNYAANGGVTPSAATCGYNGGGAAACSLTTQAAPGAGKTILVGVQIVADGTQDPGDTAAPTFDVTVTYN
jgi:hypothetical protein